MDGPAVRPYHETRDWISRARDFGALSDEEKVLNHGEYTGHTAENQIDPQHRADYQSDADGRRFQDAQSAAACACRTALRRVDEQGFRFAAKTDGSEVASALGNPTGEKGTAPDHQHRQGTVRRVEHKFVS